jgi:hypothetical protein
MTAVLVRIGLRYVAGALITKGIIAPDMGMQLAGDVDLQQGIELAIGAAAAVASEAWYYFARRFGWSK